MKRKIGVLDKWQWTWCWKTQLSRIPVNGLTSVEKLTSCGWKRSNYKKIGRLLMELFGT